MKKDETYFVTNGFILLQIYDTINFEFAPIEINFIQKTRKEEEKNGRINSNFGTGKTGCGL